MKKRKLPKLKKCRDAIDFLGRSLELPENAIAKMGKTELIGNREATVDGCRCVVDYSNEKIVLNIGSGNIKFCGSDLIITTLSGNIAVIKGLIASIEFNI